MQIVIMNNETWLICGGRDFSNHDMFNEAMNQLVLMWGCPRKIVHGACPTGADQMAGAWGRYMSIDVVAVPANWQKHGRAAGPLRNEDMLRKHRPQRLIAFPGGRGTADMVQRARNRNGAIEVIEIRAVPTCV